MTRTRRIFTLAALVAALASTGCGRSASKHFTSGVAYFQEEKFAKAAAQFERAIQAGAPTAQAWNFLGVCRLHTGQTNEAIAALQESLKLDSTYNPAHYNLALAYLDANQPEAAIPLLRILTQPAEVPAQLSRAYLHAGAWAQAKHVLEKLPDTAASPDTQNSLGVIETRLGNFKAARTHFETATKLDPTYATAVLNLAVLEHHYGGQKQAALQAYQKFIELQPKAQQREDVRLAIAQLSQDTGAKPKPVEVAVAPPAPTPVPTPTPKGADLPAIVPVEIKPAPPVVVAPPPPPPPAPLIKRRQPITVASLRSGDRLKARAYFNDGINQQQQSKLSAAIAAYNKAIATDPSYPQTYYNLAIAYRDARQPDKALDNYEIALFADPNFANARFNYAILLQQQGYIVDALAQYEKILEKTPDDVSLHLTCASLYSRDPQTKDKARQHYQAVQRLAPSTSAGRDARDWLQKNP